MLRLLHLLTLGSASVGVQSELRGAVGVQWEELQPGPGAQRLAFRPCAQLGARTSAHSAGDSEALLNKIETVIQQNKALLRSISSCGFYAPKPPTIHIAALHPPAIPIAPLQ
jgi:hypothetical protein